MRRQGRALLHQRRPGSVELAARRPGARSSFDSRRGNFSSARGRPLCFGSAPGFPSRADGSIHVPGRVRVPKPFVPFAPGRTVSRTSDGADNVLETEVDKPVQFAVILAGKYQYEEDTRSGITIRVASYGGKNQRAIKQLTNLAFGIIESYQGSSAPSVPGFTSSRQRLRVASAGRDMFPRRNFQPYIGKEAFFSQGSRRFAHEIGHHYCVPTQQDALEYEQCDESSRISARSSAGHEMTPTTLLAS